MSSIDIKPLTAETIKIGMEVEVFNKRIGKVIHRYTIMSPLWIEKGLGTMEGETCILVQYEDYTGKTVLQSVSAGDMGLTPYKAGGINPINRTYLVSQANTCITCGRILPN